MDTIIYFYKKRDLEKPVIEPVQMKDYLLLRVGINVGDNRWFSHAFTPVVTTGTAAAGSQSHHTLKARLRERRENRRRIRIQKLQRRQLRETREKVRAEMQRFLEELGASMDDRYECRCAYADSVRSCLVLPEDRGQRRGEADTRKMDVIAADCWLPILWQQCFQFPEFDAYLKPQWVEHLLENARLHHYVVLGAAESVSAAILQCAPRMKSLRWFLQERDCGQKIQDFVENFYEEYGLAVTLQPLEGERAFSRLLLETVEPVCVLDFTGEPRIPSGGLAQGSVWLDFCSVEEKARRMTERGEGVFYFSVKETWKRAASLDTKGKNEYNTVVKRKNTG